MLNGYEIKLEDIPPAWQCRPQSALPKERDALSGSQPHPHASHRTQCSSRQPLQSPQQLPAPPVTGGPRPPKVTQSGAKPTGTRPGTSPAGLRKSLPDRLGERGWGTQLGDPGPCRPGAPAEQLCPLSGTQRRASCPDHGVPKNRRQLPRPAKI